MKRLYCYAGIEYELNIPDDVILLNEGNFAAFSTEKVTKPFLFDFYVVDRLDAPVGDCIIEKQDLRVYQNGDKQNQYLGPVLQTWQNAHIHVKRAEKKYCVQIQEDITKNKIGMKTISKALDSVHLIAQNGGVIFHCSYIEYCGKAILFTAPSGTGKSTQADLWEKYCGAEIINGDRAAIRLLNDEIMIEGVPFSGSSKVCKNKTVPLGAVVYLSQNKDNVIRKISGYQAFQKIWEGCSVNTWDCNDVSKVSELISNIVNEIPIYHFACTPDKNAVDVLLKQLEEEVYR